VNSAAGANSSRILYERANGRLYVSADFALPRDLDSDDQIALEQRDRSERVDHRSYERQGLDREPGSHYGPAAAHVLGRGGVHERLDESAGG
jgi:hypothetical protein